MPGFYSFVLVLSPPSRFDERPIYYVSWRRTKPRQLGIDGQRKRRRSAIAHGHAQTRKRSKDQTCYFSD